MARIFDIDTPPENIPDKPKKNSFGWRIPSQQELRPVEGFATEPEPAEASGLAGFVDSFTTGVGNVGRTAQATAATYAGDLGTVEKTAKRNAAVPKAKENAEFMRDYAARIAKSKVEKDDVGLLDAIGDFAAAAWANPTGAAQAMVEQLPNAAPILAGGMAGAKAGAVVGTMVAPGIGTAIGTAVGAFGGMFLGNAMIETGSKAMEKANGGFTEKERSEAIHEGATKGAVIAGIDLATLGIGGRAMKLIGRAAVKAGAMAEAKVLLDAGVDVTSASAIKAALATDSELLATAKAAGNAAAKAELSTAAKAGRASTGLMLETFGEGGGEYLGEVAATGKGNVSDAVMEGLMGAGQSSIETAYNYNKAQSPGDAGLISRAGQTLADAQQKPTGQPPSTPPEQPPVDTNPDLQMQNRDRGTAASVVQVKSIANAPDFDRLGASPIADVGAPLVSIKDNADGALDQGDIGTGGTITLPDGAKVDFRYAVVDANAVLVSHDATGRGNPDYGNPQPGQIVALTNGRMAGLQEAYKIGTASQPGGYMDRLMEDAATFGIQVESITGKEAPVLVRLYDDAVNARPDIGKMSNAGGSMRMSAQEVARNDARILPDVSSLVIGEHGDLESPENQPFLRGFVHALPANERSEVLDREGRLSQVGMRRIRNAIIHRAYGESSVFGRLVESLDSGMANLSKALVRAAPKVARVKDLMAAGAARDMDVTATLIKAVAEIETMRKNGLSMADFLAQARMFDQLSPELVEVLAFLDANLRSPNRIAAFIELYYQKIEALGDPRTLDMFGAPQISSANVLKMAATAATREVQDDGVNEAGAGLGGGTGSGEILTANASGTPGGETTPRLPGADQLGAGVVEQPEGAQGGGGVTARELGAGSQVRTDEPVGEQGGEAGRAEPAGGEDRGKTAVAKKPAETKSTGKKIVEELKAKKTKKAAKPEAAPESAEQAIRDAFAALPSVTLGEFYPITVTHNGRTQQFLASQRALKRNNQPHAALTLIQVRNGRMIAGGELQDLAFTYKLTGNNELKEDGAKPASEELLKRWRDAFGAEESGRQNNVTEAPRQAVTPDVAANMTAPPSASERYNALVKRWNDLVSSYQAADDQGKAAIKQAMDLLDAEMKAARGDILLDGKRQAAEAQARARDQLQQELAAMPVGARMRPSEFGADAGIFWEKTGDNEWTARGDWFQKGQTRTNAELAERGGLVEMPAAAAPSSDDNVGTKPKQEQADPFAGNKLFTSDESKATVSLRGKAAGDMLEMGNGTLYRIAGIDTAANRIRLARNPDQLSERTVLVDQDGYNKLLADHEQTMAEAMAMVAAPAPESLPANLSVKQEPARDQSGNVIQREKLEGDDRYKKSPRYPNEPESHATARADVVDYMNGDIDRPTLMQRLEAANLPEGVIYSITQRMGEDGPSIGEVNAMMARRKAAEAKPEVETKGGDKKPAPKKKPNADKTRGKADPFAGNKLFTSDKVAAARERLRKKLSGSQLNSGIDPELLMDGITIAGAYIESGVRNFTQYAARMIQDMGDGVKPYLLSFWEAARNYPGLDTKGMTSVEESKRLHEQMLTPEVKAQAAEAIGEVAPKPAKRTKKTGSKADMTLTQDWGVDHINGYGDANLETGNTTKDAFLAEARNYLRAVEAILAEHGYSPQPDRNGRPRKGVSVNEGGAAGSGEVSLAVFNPEVGAGVYVHIVDTALRGAVPVTPSGIAVMFRATKEGDPYGALGPNRWAPTDLSAADLAAMVDHEVRRVAASKESPKIDAQERSHDDGQATAGAAGDGAQEQGAGSVQPDAGGRDAEGVSGGPDGRDAGGDQRGAAGRDRRPGERGEPDVRARSARPDAGDQHGDEGGRGDRAGAGDRDDRGPVSRVGSNYRIQPGELKRTGSWRATAEQNVRIVELVKQLEREGRRPTPEEAALLTKFTGWGATEIANGIFPDRYGRYKDATWQALGERLKAALTPEEYAQARRTTQYAHYTSEGVIRSIYDGLRRLGFAGGRVLEPGMGIGLFNGLMPADMAASSQYTGIEYDSITGAIAKLLYPQSNVIVGDYTKTALPREFFDAAIGNPPFGSIAITNDPEYKKHGFMLHDYFFAKTIDRVKPGGLVVFVTSKGTMDKANDRARKYLAERANLLGAIRLPQTAFKDNAGTEVVTDVIFLQKRGPGIKDNGVKWLGTADVQTPQGPATINEYFAAHPEMVLGAHSLTGSMYRANEYTVVPEPGVDLEQAFARAVANLPEGVYRPGAKNPVAAAAVARERDFNPTHKKEGGLYVAEDGRLMQVESGTGVELMHRRGADGKLIALKPNDKAFLKSWVGLRDALKQAQLDQLTDGDWEKSLKALAEAYDAFVAKHGNLLAYTTIERQNEDGTVTVTKRFKNDPLLRLDVDGALAYSLEHIKETGEIVKAPVLSQRVLQKRREPEIKTTQDALFVSLNALGRLDLDDVARRAGMSRQEVIDALGTAIYEAPGEGWQTADEYLSGNVVRKLKEAQAAARADKRYQRNVEALLAVQPKPLGPTEITVKLGQNWIPPSYIEAFAREVLNEDIQVSYNPRLGAWSAEQSGSNYSEFNTPKMSAGAILDAVLNNRTIRVTYRDQEGKTHVDAEATEKANDVARKMREAFSRWIWTDTKRADRLVNYYNEHFNNIAPRQYDGSHLTLPGVSLRFNLYPHQKRAIWRMIQDGDTYLAHSVGAGKTFTMIAAGMEGRRLGLSNKPMYVVPNHMLAQFAREFLELYPAANIMVADEQNFHTHNRRRFVAQAALNDPDAIIITHSAFSRIGMSDEFAERFIADQIEEWKQSLEETDQSDRITRKQIERRIEQLERRLEARQSKDKKDQVLSFEELGVDRLFVDESHEYRKLDFATNQGNIKGIDPQGSQRALDLFMKVQYLRSKKPGRALVMASGTPITNTMGELFTVQRFFQPDQLAEDGLDTFDAWANQYGDVVAGFEQNAAGGYEVVSRFAKFQNMPELMRRVRSFMDILTSSSLGELVQRPAVKGGGREIVVTPEPDGYRAYQKTLEARINAIRQRKGPPKKGEDIILNVIADGRFSAIDMRFVDPGAPPDPKSKLNQALDDLIAAYFETKDYEYTTNGQVDPIKGSSLILFTDIGLGEQSAKSRGFDMKAWIEKRLTDAGIPREHIAFMRDHKEHAKKERLFADMREGKKRILIGGKDMETGVNVQKRLTHLFHLDAPWFPASVEQREGRIVRQGNQNKEVVIRAYATKGSYDSTMWGMNGRKARFIEQAMNGDDSVRSLEDVSEASAFEMAAALASGDERYLRLAGLKADVERLERLAHAHHDDQNKLRRDKHSAEASIEHNRKLVAELKEAVAKRTPIRAGEFAGKVGRATYDKRDEFSNALFKRFKELTATETIGEETIGEIGGFPIKFHGLVARGSGSYYATVEVGVPGDHEPLLAFPLDPDLAVGGIATRAANQVNSLDRLLSEAETKIEQNQRRIEQISQRLGAPFPEQAELLDKMAEMKALEAELTAEKAAEGGQPVSAEAAAAIEHQKQRLDDLGFGDAVRELLGGIGETKFSRTKQQEVGAGDAAIKRMTEAEAESAGFTMKAYRGVSKANPYNDSGTVWMTTSKDQAEAYAEEVFGYDDAAVIELRVKPDGLPVSDMRKISDEDREALGVDGFGNPQKVGIYRNSDDGPLGSGYRQTVIHAPASAVVEVSDDTNPDIRYARGNRGGVHADDLAAAVKTLRAAFPGLQFHPLEQESQAPDELLNAIKAAGGDVAAAMHKGEVYLFAPSLKDASDVLNRGLHEAVHVGLARMFGTALDPLLLDIHRSNVKVQLRAARIKAKYGYSPVRSVEEVLADMGPEAKSLKGWQKLVAWVRSKLRAAGLVRDWSDADIEALVLRALAAAKKPADTHIARGSVFAEKPVTIDEKPKFSRTEQQEPEPSSIDIRNATLQRVEEILRRKASGETIIDTMIRVPMQAVGIDKVTRLGGKVVRKIIDVAPESIKAGMVSDYGNPDDAINHRDAMFGHQRRRLRGVAELMERMAVMSREESRVAYEWLNNRNADELLESLPEKSRADMIEIKQQIDDIGKEAVDLGLLSVDAYEAHKGAYVHRSYRKWDIDSTKGERTSREYTKQILGEQFKTRGLTELVPMVRVQNTNPTFWKRKIKTGTADHGLRGEQFIRFERHKKAVGTASLPGVEGAEQAGKVVEVQYWPASEPVPARYGAWHQAGTFTVRGTKGDKLIMNRDWTKSEREKMGEIEDARYAIAKTFHQMIHDIEVAKYLQWIAGHYGKEVPPRGVIPVKASESMRNVFGKDDWVQVPNSTVGDTTIKRYGKLSGLYIPGPIWNDIRQVANHNYQPFGETYANILKAWKLSKTALSPVVHTNNIMSNFVMADWHDVRAGDVLEALHIIVRQKDPANKELLGRFEDSGGTIGMYTLSEIKRDQLEPLIEQLRADVAKVGELHGMVGAGAALQSLLHGRMKEAYEIARSTKSGRMSAAVVKKMMDLYEDEDTVFRLAAFIKAKRNGATDLEAGKIARRSFLDYNINAPWIQAMRQTAFPFISFTYRAVPMLLEIIETKPWKIAKLAAFAGLLNALGYALSGGDEDKERRYLPNEKSGRVWGIVPKLIRMPWNDANDSPVFLDIRRWIPVGDVLDTGQSHAALPLIPVVIPGGPVALLAELLANKSQFTGKEITKRTDTAGEKTAAVIEHLFKAFAPNLFFLPGTYAATSVVNAGTGRTDVFGREQSVGMALASGIGIKLAAYPTDVLQRNATLELKSQLREINENMYGLGRERAVGGLSDADFSRKIQRESEKRKRLVEEFQRR